MSLIAIAPLVLIAALLLSGTVVARRRGYTVGGEAIVRCRAGPLLTTICIPGVPFEALKLLWPTGFKWGGAIARDASSRPIMVRAAKA